MLAELIKLRSNVKLSYFYRDLTWRGEKEQRTGYWLRWWDEAGNLLLWGVEQLATERERVLRECERADRERERADRLAEYLRDRGINPDEII